MPSALWAGAPEEMVKGATGRILTILRDSSLKVPDKVRERRQKLWEEISAAFDFEEISKRAMGHTYWIKRSPEEKKEFVALFSYIVQDSYIGKIDAYSDEEIVYLGEKQKGRYAKVKTKIITNTGTEITVDYRLLDEQGEWRIYDVIVEGVSLVNNYRSQFNNILVKSSYEKLVKKMKQKMEERKVSAK
jgi:phospholipid transport system substrate-binding protein